MEAERPTDGDAEARTRRAKGVDESEVADAGRGDDEVEVVVVGAEEEEAAAAVGREPDRVTYCRKRKSSIVVNPRCQGNCRCYGVYHYCCCYCYFRC